MSETEPWSSPEQMPRWIWKAVAIFWLGFIVTVITRSVWASLSELSVLLLVSLFLSLAVEPGVNRMAARGHGLSWENRLAPGRSRFQPCFRRPG